ncbi:unnamed protein product [Notodromas monacha]|uniref:WD repeat-containing protein 19 n=1 Tax=Notodromas monacha TaxID=399045 RepID=A0A7R9BTM1_9CRUS|nr:unnamed protein product [Notodromas monacha]CAG0921516.1 unnamed protein product [Notodromas monacha]
MTSKRVFTIESPHGPGGVFFCWQKSSGNYLVTTGYNQAINLYSRQGEAKDRLTLQGLCSGFGWDKDGDFLAVINDKTPLLLLWDSRTFKSTTIDTGLQDQHTFLIWSKSAPLLAIGTAKGNVVIYNSKTSRKIPVIGKHAKRIMCGAWSKQSLLALGSEDRTLTVSNAEGDTIKHAQLRGDPSDIQFSTMKADERKSGENTISLIISRKTLFLFNLDDPENPIELAFQSRYGNVVAYEWFGDGYVLLGFSQGYFVAISTHMKEIGQELFQARNHRDSLTDIAVNAALGKAASCGDNQIKIHELSDLREVSEVVSLDEERAIDGVAWSDDGQLLAVSTPKGNLHVFLSKLPMLGEAVGAQAVYLTGLDTVTIRRIDAESGLEWTRRLDVEPTFLGIGPTHYAAGMNNRVWFYALGPPDKVSGGLGAKRFVKDKEYAGNVTSVKLNEVYAAVLHDGKVLLHLVSFVFISFSYYSMKNECVLWVSNNQLVRFRVNNLFCVRDFDNEPMFFQLEADAGETEEREMKLFPGREQQTDIVITDHGITQDFFIFSTDFGGLFYFGLDDWSIVSDYKHRVGIRKIFPEITGSRLILIDNKSEAFLYSPVNDETISIPSTPAKALAVLWENWLPDRNVFIIHDDTWIYTYIFRRESIDGASVEQVGKTRLPLNQRPLILVNGELTCQTPGGRLTTLTLSTHEMVASVHDLKAEELQLALEKNLALGRFKDAWQVCLALDKREEWVCLGEAAMRNMEVETAARAYRQAGDVGMVWFLEDLSGCQDRVLMAGHLCMALNEYDKAQEWYLKSGTPVCALEMRRDLLHWDQALQLANKLAPAQIPAISREYAQQLEFTGDYPQALVHYEKAIGSDTSVPVSGEDSGDEHQFACRAGIARTCIRCGDLRRGVQIAGNIDSKAVKKDCAEILESMKNWPRVGELLPNVTSPRIHLQFAKAKESEGRYKEALAAYDRARDYDSVVRLLLDHLEDPEAAVKVVRDTKSVEGAKMVAKFFLKLNDFGSAIQFLVLSKCNDEAFRLAQQHNKMELYADIIGDDATHEDYASIALHFETTAKNLFLSGKFYFLAGKYEKAMSHLLRHAGGTGRTTTTTSMRESAGGEDRALQLAVDVAAASGDDKLSGQLIDFLLGDVDGVPKDARYLFRLYMAKKMFRQAAKTAVIIAGEEQSRGNYRVAHDVLLGMCGELRGQNLPVGQEMQNALALLHSYVLVRVQVKRGEHKIAARLLARVARSISKFPAHVVPILTSTVIECQRSGMKATAFNYAAVLMRPEHRSRIDDKYKSKIEAIVRKNAGSRAKEGSEVSGEDEELGVKTPCPACAFPDLPEMDLDCPRCKTRLPFCLATKQQIFFINYSAEN